MISKKIKTIFQYMFLLLLIVSTIYLVLTTLDIRLLPDIIKMVDTRYILLGMLLVIIYMSLEVLVFNVLLKSINVVNNKFIAVKLATMGFYYNLVTPFASGSQPMQIYLLSKNNVSVGESSAIITNKTVLFQSVVTIFAVVSVIFNLDLLRNEMPEISFLIFTGLAVNIVTIVGGILIILNPKKVKSILKTIIPIVNKIKFVNLSLSVIEKFIDEYHFSIVDFVADKKVLFKCIILTIIQLTVYFSISYTVYKAFSMNEINYLTILVLQNFLYMAVSPIPTPGNVGANEIGFMTIFEHIFPSSILGYAVFLYGMLIYYLILLISGIITIHTHYKLNKLDKAKNIKSIN